MPASASSIPSFASCGSFRDGPVAELWVGAHPSGSASLVSDTGEVNLREAIAAKPGEFLGQAVYEKYGQLPFLFKVLSIGEALSIQSHPDKELAGDLHRKDPINYPDDNHKPEAAFALKTVHLLYGLKDDSSLRKSLAKSNALKNFFGAAEGIQGERDLTMFCFQRLFSATVSEVREASLALQEELSSLKTLFLPEQYLLKICCQYSEGDVGILAFPLLNFLTLNPGEAVFIAPNTPHAYLDGELVECMANSDNVIRAGLTPKFKDTDALLRSLKRLGQHDEGGRISPVRSDGCARFALPTDEFSFDVLTNSADEIEFGTCGKVEILFSLAEKAVIVVDGNNYELNRGEAYLVPAIVDSYSITVGAGSLFRVFVP